MSNKSVVVLAPNGRRQNVKVTPNTTILQVLEDVCSKQGFKPEEYDIRHHNKILDATSIMRYTGLPNNAQLEMAVAAKIRSETRVKVGLALESGDRVMGEFEPADSLWHVVKTLCPDEAEADETANILPVIFYVGREECGTENLKKTTLRSLGLTSGGAILRFFKKTPEELHHQANVSAPISRPIMLPQEPSVKASTSNLRELSTSERTSISQSSLKTLPASCSVPDEPSQSQTELKNLRTDEADTHALKVNKTTSPASNILVKAERSESDVMEMDYEDSTGTSAQISSPVSTLERSDQEAGPSAEPEETIVFLGERNAVLFDVATARACKPEDVPDDFFDLTFDDAKQLLRDLKRRQAVLEEQPLVTSQYRELEKSKQMLNALSQYKRCVIKVQFPNQLVLQGTFTPLEKISHVLAFIRNFLQDPNVEFHIFTTPPKKILSANLSLFEADCVPGALVHFLSSAACPENGSFIRDDIMAQVSSAAAAAAAAATARKPRNLSTFSNADPMPRNNASSSRAIQSSSTTTSAAVSRPSTSSQGEASDKKVPKWFKPNQK